MFVGSNLRGLMPPTNSLACKIPMRGSFNFLVRCSALEKREILQQFPAIRLAHMYRALSMWLRRYALSLHMLLLRLCRTFSD